MYVQTQGAVIQGSEGVCDGLQTYKINPTSGVLTYNGTGLFYADRYDGIVTYTIDYYGNIKDNGALLWPNVSVGTMSINP